MCKLAIMSGITPETQENAWLFIKQMAKEMSSPNTTESDGMGYAAIDDTGNLFGERWVNNKDAFQHRNPYGNELDNTFIKKFKILTKERIYNSFGKMSDNFRTITLHSRMATSAKGMRNTHPFVKKGTSLIHNGVISNDHKLHKEMSSCDSEVILHEYLKYDVMNNPDKFQKVANKLEGYYALGILSRTNEGQVILDIVKDNTANLKAYFIKELNTIVYATPKYINNTPVEETCRVLGFTIMSQYELKSNKLLRLDAMTGEPIAFESFKPKERIYTGNHYTQDNKTYRDNNPVNTYPFGKDEETAETKWEKLVGEKLRQKDNNVIDMTSHSHTKHETQMDEKIKDKLLDDILSEKKLSPEQMELVGQAMSEHDFNDEGEEDWIMDDKFAWYKKTMA